MKNKISIMGTLTEGITIGIKNVVPLILTYLLYVLTVWIPYINVGTTIAISTIPIALSKGQIINPLFIFEAKYRQYMGEYFLLIGFVTMGITSGMLFFFIPGIVIAIAWSLSLLLFIDKGLTPLAAIQKSNELTYGYKWKIFAISILLAIAALIVIMILALIPVVGGLLSFAVLLITMAAESSCKAVIYRNLTSDDATPAPVAEPVAEPVAVAEPASEPKKSTIDLDNPFPEE